MNAASSRVALALFAAVLAIAGLGCTSIPEEGPAAPTIEAGDFDEPTWPEGSSLRATNVGPTHAALTWSPAADDMGGTSYELKPEAGVLAASQTTITMLMELEPGTQHELSMHALEAAGNRSAAGPTARVKTLPSYRATSPGAKGATGP